MTNDTCHMTKKRLIDANALTHEIIFVKKCLASEDKIGEWAKGYRSGLEAAISQIYETHTVDAVEVVHGRWERVIPTKSAAKWSTKVSCSACHKQGYTHHKFCPNCGARMDGDGNV